MENKIRKIREACIKSNPEKGYIHSFPVGKVLCEFCSIPRRWQERIPHLETKRKDEHTGGSTMEVTMRDHSEEGKSCPKRDFTVRLADVLLAVPLYAKEMMRIDFSKNALYVKGIELWWLKNDDLRAQSKEAIDFIYELIYLKETK